jgi:hypothetical protein
MDMRRYIYSNAFSINYPFNYTFDKATYIEIVAMNDDGREVWFEKADQHLLRFGQAHRPPWDLAWFDDPAVLLDVVTTIKEKFPHLIVWYDGPEVLKTTRVHAPIWSSMIHLMAAHDEAWKVPLEVVHNGLPMDDPRTVEAISEEPLIATAIDRLEKLKASGIDLPRNSGILQFAFTLPASAAS